LNGNFNPAIKGTWLGRLAIAEPVLANIRINKRLDRFTLRGEVKVNIQWLMFCLAHNLEKIMDYRLAFA